MSTQYPHVSVVIPAYNCAHCLGGTIASVQAQKHINDIEIIVVNDGSTDNTSELVADMSRRDSRIKSIRHDRNEGVSAARNTGIKAAAGELIAFLDSDDTWFPTKLFAQIHALREDLTQRAIKKVLGYGLSQSQINRLPRHSIRTELVNKAIKTALEQDELARSRAETFCLTYYSDRYANGEAGVHSHLGNVEGQGKQLKINLKTYSEEELLCRLVTWDLWVLPGSTLLAHRTAIEKNGFFDAHLGCGEDREYLIRHILNNGKVTVIPYPLASYLIPEPGKIYSGENIHYQYMVDTYRCRVIQRFGAAAAKKFIENMYSFHMERITSERDWAGASYELTVLPNAPCENGFECSLKGNPCRPRATGEDTHAERLRR